jgi:hypothetical protein
MATFVKTPSGTWKALIRKNGWPTTAKTFRTKRDAKIGLGAPRTKWFAARTSRTVSEKMTVKAALERYLSEVTPTKKPTTQRSEGVSVTNLISFLGSYSLAAVSSELVASY